MLVQQIALGDQDHRIGIFQRVQHGACMGQQLNIMAQHIAPGVQDFCNHGAWHFAIGHLDRGFDHRQGEPFDPKPIMGQVTALCGQQAVHEMGLVGML